MTDRVLAALSNSADPEQAARYLALVLWQISAPAAYVNALGADHEALRRLITAFGASAFVGDAVSGRPELADVILVRRRGRERPTSRGARRDWNAAPCRFRRTPIATSAKNPSSGRYARPNVASRSKSRWPDLAGTIGMRDATRILADLAEEILSCVVRHVFGDDAGLRCARPGQARRS